MNYPIWDIPAPGLLIAFVAIVHVFVSHFAVGGGLFLVVAERKARRENDGEFLAFLERIARWFILLTLVFGAVTGVGIWFTIGLVHPAATSSLINTFVWGWAIEWTFFVIEIAAATVYYYGWKTLDAKTHLRVGWCYFWSAWLSLVVINGILAYMLTPGRWLETRDFWDGFLNPTYVSSVVLRTLVAVGLTGLYAMFAASLGGSEALKAKVARWAGTYWVLPAALGIPLSMIWYLNDALRSGVPVSEVFGAASANVGALIGAALMPDASSGYPMAQMALRVAAIAFPLIIVGTLAILLFRGGKYGPVTTGALLVLGLAGMGAGEWAREDLRKPWVIGNYMYVHGVRVPAGGIDEVVDPFARDVLEEQGVLVAAHWVDLPEGWIAGEGPDAALDPEARARCAAEAGQQLFRLQCSQCHTLDGYHAMRPLVAGWTVGAAETLLGRLDAHRGRRMPPFVGTEVEKNALAVYLARLGGDESAGVLVAAPASRGAILFEEQCAICHAADSDFPIEGLVAGKATDELFDIIGRLPEINEMMMPFEGDDEDRRALARYLAGEDAAAGEADPLAAGREVFNDKCMLCHDASGEFALQKAVAGKSVADIEAMIDRLPEIDGMMAPFDGTDAERAALAAFLAAPPETSR